MELNLADKKALVFGGSSGLGFAIAEAFHGEQMVVGVCSRPGPRLERVENKLPGVHLFGGDLSKAGEGKRVAEEALKKMGGVDIVILNTGGPPTGTFDAVTAEKWQQGFQNLWLSAVESIQVLLPHFREKKSGRIVLIGSTSAREPIANLTVSNGLRAGLMGLLKSLSNEVARDGITVNMILPGFIATERLVELGVREEEILKMIPAGRLGKPEEVAHLATFLASDAAAYITGQAINCDGGRVKSI